MGDTDQSSDQDLDEEEEEQEKEEQEEEEQEEEEEEKEIKEIKEEDDDDDGGDADDEDQQEEIDVDLKDYMSVDKLEPNKSEDFFQTFVHALTCTYHNYHQYKVKSASLFRNCITKTNNKFKLGGYSLLTYEEIKDYYSEFVVYVDGDRVPVLQWLNSTPLKTNILVFEKLKQRLLYFAQRHRNKGYKFWIARMAMNAGRRAFPKLTSNQIKETLQELFGAPTRDFIKKLKYISYDIRCLNPIRSNN